MEHLVERKNSHYSFALWVLSLLFLIAGIFSLKLDMAPQMPERQETTKTVPEGLSNGHPIKMETDETGTSLPEKADASAATKKTSGTAKDEPKADVPVVILKEIPAPKKDEAEKEKKTGKDDKGVSCQERGDCWKIIVNKY